MNNNNRTNSNSNSGSNNNNNNMGTRANLTRRMGNIQRNYSRLLSNRNTFNATPAQWNAMGNQSRATQQYILNHNHTAYARDAGFTRTLRRMIARSNAYNPNARLNSNSNSGSNNNSNSGSNSNSNSGSNNNATRLSRMRRLRARVRAERAIAAVAPSLPLASPVATAPAAVTAAEYNHRRTLNTRLANLQGRHNRLIDPSFTGAGTTQWNSLGNGAESLFQYILNHNIVGYARGTRTNRLHNIASVANAYGPYYNSNNNNNDPLFGSNGNANNRVMATFVGASIAADARKFERDTKWNVNSKNNAQAWYSNNKVKPMNTNVIRNLLGGRVFRPSDINNLYFDSNNKTQRHVFTKQQLINSRGRNPFYSRNTLVVPRKLPANVKKAMVEFMNERINKSTKIDINKQRGRGGKRRRHLETVDAALRYYNNSNNNGNNTAYKTAAQRMKINRELKKLG